MFERSQIQSVIFDLDGTLVETEHLKAQAYAKLIGELTGRGSPEPRAIELYRSIVGATDLVVCEAMLEGFSISSILKLEPGESPVDALHRQRMDVYTREFGTPENLKKLVYQHNIELAIAAAEQGLQIGSLRCRLQRKRVG